MGVVGGGEKGKKRRGKATEEAVEGTKEWEEKGRRRNLLKKCKRADVKAGKGKNQDREVIGIAVKWKILKHTGEERGMGKLAGGGKVRGQKARRDKGRRGKRDACQERKSERREKKGGEREGET